MREVWFERALVMDPNRALPRLEQALTPRGYQASARSTHEFSFLGVTTSGRHRLTVRADGRAVRFTFAPGAPGLAMPSDAELEQLTDATLAALGEPVRPVTAASPVAASRRCTLCATPLGPGDTACPVCGMPG